MAERFRLLSHCMSSTSGDKESGVEGELCQIKLLYTGCERYQNMMTDEV